jgi:arylsulfatase A-like enzyme
VAHALDVVVPIDKVPTGPCPVSIFVQVTRREQSGEVSGSSRLTAPGGARYGDFAMSQPNVVVFFTDQQRWDTTGVHGNPLELTPNFDRVAQEGTHFASAFTCQPVCAPARSCLQTGLYATQTGVFHNGLPLKDDAVTLADGFGEVGYRTGYIGKWHLGGVDPGFFGGQAPVPPERRGGYDYWLAADLSEFVSDAYHTVLFDGDGQPVELPGYRVDACTDAAIRYIDAHRREPFFLFLSFVEPHFQNHRDDYPAPEGYAERYVGRWMPPDLAALGGSAHQHLAGYFGMVKRLDEAFGRLQDALKSLGLRDNTIVLFASDHGCHFKTRNDEYKRSCHEASVRIPAAACGPGFDGGGRVQQLVSLLDLAPTLLDAAGLVVPAQMSGRSALPLLRGGSGGPSSSGRSAAWPEEVFIQISESQVGRAVRTARWKYNVSAPEKDGFRDPDAPVYEEEFLYDLKADPYELVNLIGLRSHREVATRMRGRLLQRMREAGEKESEIRPAPEREGPGHRRVFPEEIDQ